MRWSSDTGVGSAIREQREYALNPSIGTVMEIGQKSAKKRNSCEFRKGNFR